MLLYRIKKFLNDTPVLKKSTLDRDKMSSYWPISNLPFRAKVAEKVAADTPRIHLHVNHLHETIAVSVYRKNHSVENALLKISDDILRAIDNNKQS